MKKILSKLLLITAVLATAFSLTACGRGNTDKRTAGEKETKRQEKTSDKEEDAQDSSQNASQNKENNALYDSVADYVNSDALQAMLNQVRSSLQEGIGIDIIAEGENKLVYIFTYQTVAHVDGDGMADALAQAVGEQDATFQQTAESIKPFVSCDSVIVEVRYVDMNGAVIFSKEYTAE